MLRGMMVPIWAFVVLLCCTSCGNHNDESLIDLQKLVLNHQKTSTDLFLYLCEVPMIQPEDQLWLISRLVDDDPSVRAKAAEAVGKAHSEGGAAALYLACLPERVSWVYGTMLMALAGMGDPGRERLVAVLEERGVHPALLAALAYNSGVKPPLSASATPDLAEHGVTALQGLEWWEKVGKRELGHLVPKEPKSRWPEDNVEVILPQ